MGEDRTNMKKELGVILDKILRNKKLIIVEREEKINKIINIYDKHEKTIKEISERKVIDKTADASLYRHKLAAACFCAVLSVKPIEYADKLSIIRRKHDEKYANQKCGYYFGKQVIQTVLNGSAEKGKDIKGNALNDEDIIIYKNPLKTPTINSYDYEECFFELAENMDLYFTIEKDKHHEKNLLLYIAHLYFLLDNYSYEYHRAELYLKELNKKKKT